MSAAGAADDDELAALASSFSGVRLGAARPPAPSLDDSVILLPPTPPPSPPRRAPSPLLSPPPARPTAPAPSPALIPPGLLKPLRPYQAAIVRQVQELYLGLQAAPLSRRTAPCAPLRCCPPPSAPTATHAPTAAGCAAALAAPAPAPAPLPGSALLYLPTGGGKTRIAGEVTRWAVRCGARVLFVVNRTKLVGQAARAFGELGLARDVCVWGERGADEARAVHIATVQALAARERRVAAAAAAAAAATAAAAAASSGAAPPAAERALPAFDLLILDEAHSAVSPSYLPLWAGARTRAAASRAPAPLPPLTHARPFVLGLTATPVRHGDSATLGRYFEALLLGPSLTDLVQQGVLVEPVAVSCAVPELAAALRGGGGAGSGGSSGSGGGGGGSSSGGSSSSSSASALAAAAARRAGSGGSSGGGARAPGSHLLQGLGQEGGEDGEGEGEGEGEEDEAAVSRAAEALERALLRPAFFASTTAASAPAAASGPLQAIVRAWQQRCGGSNYSAASAGSSSIASLVSGRALPPPAPPTPARPTIIFAPTVASSSAIAGAFLAAGVPAAHVDGGMAASAREAIYSAMAAGRLLVLSSVGVVSEGYDEPTIAAVLLLRPTASRGLYVQQVGRGLRCSPGKGNCLVLDFVQATLRHGPVTSPLLGRDGSEAGGEGGGGGGDAGDEGAVAKAAVAARMAAARASGTAAALPPYQTLLAQESAKARAAAIREGRTRVWACPAPACAVINHGTVGSCAGCGGARPASKAASSSSSSSSSGSSSGSGSGSGSSSSSSSGGGGEGGGGSGAAAAASGIKPLPVNTMQSFLLHMEIPRKKAAVPAAAPAAAAAAEGGSQPAAAGAGEGGGAAALAAALGALALDKGRPLQPLPQPLPQPRQPSSGSSGAGAAAAAPAPAPARAPPSATAASSAPAPRASAPAPAHAPAPAPAPAAAPALAPAAGLCHSDAFRAACARQGLPPFDLANACNAWEREFLGSLAAFVTPGAAHAWKSDAALEGKRASDRQREILARIVGRGRGSGGGGGGGGGGGAQRQ